MENDPIYEYELVDIEFEEEFQSLKIQEESDFPSEIVYDKDGIPMGNSIEEIRKREEIIATFLTKWRENNTEGKILNNSLQDVIYFRNVSFIEAKEHSAKSYNSTRAVMILDEVVANALPVRRVATKFGDKN